MGATVLITTLIACGSTGAAPVIAIPAMISSEQIVGSPTYLAMGDSITVGAPYVDQGEVYAERLAARQGWQLTRIAGGGWRVDQGLRHVEAPNALSVVSIEYGTNDAAQNVPLATFGQNYAALLALFPDSRLICLGTWQGLAPYDAIIRSLCLDAGGSYVDLGTMFRAHLFSVYDGFHPNAVAHQIIATQINLALSDARGTRH